MKSKNHEGKIEPYNALYKWIDGTIQNDLHVLRLRRMHNINHFIVSQTNPQVIPFLSTGNHSNEPVELISEALKSIIQKNGIVVLDIIRKSLFVRKFSRIPDVLHGILEQNYYGNVTIHPPFSAINYRKMFSNPTEVEIENLLLCGERESWPKVDMVSNQTKISRTLRKCLEKWRPL